MLVKCHAGCKVDAVCAAVGLRVLDLMPTADLLPMSGSRSPNGKPCIVAQYDYRDESGVLIFQAVRYEPKDFRQRRPKEGGDWNWSVKGVRVVPYRLPELVAEPTRAVVIVEGEKDVDRLARLGVLATCNAGGAGKWTVEHSEFLRGRNVVVLADNDKAGRQHAQQVALTLQGVATAVRGVELPGLAEKGDVSDWLEAGGKKEELKRLIEATPEWTAVAQPWGKISSFDELKLPNFPTDALPDVLRDWVNAESLATQTPADLAGLLVLAVVASTIARRVIVEARPGWREPVNLFVTVLMEPGNRKSAVFTDALKPLRELENELIEAARPEVAKAQSERRQLVARLKKLEKITGDGKGTAETRQEAEQIAEQLAGEPEPVLPRLLVDDAPSPTYDVNPEVFEKEKGQKRSHNSHNSASGPEDGNCGNIGNDLVQSENENRVQVTI